MVITDHELLAIIPSFDALKHHSLITLSLMSNPASVANFKFNECPCKFDGYSALKKICHCYYSAIWFMSGCRRSFFDGFMHNINHALTAPATHHSITVQLPSTY